MAGQGIDFASIGAGLALIPCPRFSRIGCACLNCPAIAPGYAIDMLMLCQAFPIIRLIKHTGRDGHGKPKPM